MVLIEVRDLTYSAGERIFFDGLSVAFHEGEKAAIVGEVGAGRSDLLNIITGISRPSMGTVLVFGKDVNQVTLPELEEIRSRIGYVLYNVALVSNMKVIENVTLPLLYHTDLPDQEVFERSAELLKRVGFDEDIWAMPGPLPLAKKKAVGMARAMSLDPDIMIYDRFLEGLDHGQRGRMIDLIEDYHVSKDGRLTIFMVNDVDEIEGIGFDRILSIKDRRMRE